MSGGSDPWELYIGANWSPDGSLLTAGQTHCDWCGSALRIHSWAGAAFNTETGELFEIRTCGVCSSWMIGGKAEGDPMPSRSAWTLPPT